MTMGQRQFRPVLDRYEAISSPFQLLYGRPDIDAFTDHSQRTVAESQAEEQLITAR